MTLEQGAFRGDCEVHLRLHFNYVRAWLVGQHVRSVYFGETDECAPGQDLQPSGLSSGPTGIAVALDDDVMEWRVEAGPADDGAEALPHFAYRGGGAAEVTRDKL